MKQKEYLQYIFTLYAHVQGDISTTDQECQPYSYIEIKETSVPMYEKLQATYLGTLYTTKWNIPSHHCEIRIDFLILNAFNNK
jgi:hypothetical protein